MRARALLIGAEREVRSDVGHGRTVRLGELLAA
jgi:hypothetical protein